MDEKRKNEYDAWTGMRDHAWREFEEKTRTEWRLSFGIWAALLTSSGAILSSDTLLVSPTIKLAAWIMVVVVMVIHTRFLYWIQESLRTTREYHREAEAKMRKIMDLDPVDLGPRKSLWKQPSVQIQILITILVCTTLLLVVYSLPKP